MLRVVLAYLLQDIDNIYLANNTRVFSLMDFEHLPVV